MVINALNANVKVFMADFEDSLAPDWNKVIDELKLTCVMQLTAPSVTNERPKLQLKPNPAVLICRVRSLHLPEKHVFGVVRQSPAACLILRSISSNYQALLAKGQWSLFLSAENPVLAGSGLVERSLQLCRRSL